MKKLKIAIGMALALASVFAAPTFASTASTSFQVTITITNTCDAASLSAANINFGTHTFLDPNPTATGSVAVRCTNGAGYTLSLDAGLNPSTAGNTATRRMLNGTSNYISYGLYSDSAATASWGNTLASGWQSETGTGVLQTFPVYGKAILASVPAGVYTDTVQATVTY